jgi:uncharacterized membrane protein
VRRQDWYPIIGIGVFALCSYALHRIIFILAGMGNALSGFIFPLEVVYAFFCIWSLVIMLILIKVCRKNIDNTGYTFLLLTSLKMGLSMPLVYPILNSGSAYVATEKINFFIVFSLFLLVETIATIRLLNKK